MRKQLIKLAFTALTFAVVMSFNTMAAENETETESSTQSSIQTDNSGNITLVPEGSAKDNATVFKLSLKVEPEAENADEANVTFNFSSVENVKVAEYRYNPETNILNIYMADSEPIFKDTVSSMDLGNISAKDDDGNSIRFNVAATEDSLQFASGSKIITDSAGIDNLTPNEYNLKISKTFESSYTVTIPDGTEQLTEGQIFSVSADNVLIGEDETLRVSVRSLNSWKMKENPESEKGVGYQLAYGDDETVITGDSATDILNIDAGTDSGKVDIIVDSVDDATTAGKFKDTLVFSIEIS